MHKNYTPNEDTFGRENRRHKHLPHFHYILTYINQLYFTIYLLIDTHYIYIFIRIYKIYVFQVYK